VFRRTGTILGSGLGILLRPTALLLCCCFFFDGRKVQIKNKMQRRDYQQNRGCRNSKKPVDNHLFACQFGLELVRTGSRIYTGLVAF